jgi:hypothetical protein
MDASEVKELHEMITKLREENALYFDALLAERAAKEAALRDKASLLEA